MGSGARMRETILRLLDTLPADKTAVARFAFDGPERTEWSYFPKEMIGSTFFGLPLLELTPAQQHLIYEVLESGVSPYAFAKVHSIRALEPTLDSREGYTRSTLRDSLRYYLAIFGDPAAGGVWGWRFEGHHVSVSHTIADDEVLSSTPMFFGSNPGEIRRGNRGVLRPNGEEEDAGRTLVTGLDADRLATAMIDVTAPIDLLTANAWPVPEVARPGDPRHPIDRFQVSLEALDDATKDNLTLDLSRPKGIAYGDLDTDQKRAFDDLLDVYVSRLPDHLAESQAEQIDVAGREHIHFAWAGETTRLGPHYYRIQGPDLLIEYDCVQDDANHIHAVWRRPDTDFGGDPLRLHRSQGH